MIGVFFGLLVFGAVEHLLWPVRAQDALRARLAEMLHLLAELARSRTTDKPPTVIADEVDSWRRRISQKVEDIQAFIESSKFEAGELDVDTIQKCTGYAQLVFVLLLSLARQSREREMTQAAAADVDSSIARALDALANHLSDGSEPAVPQLNPALNAFERSIATIDAGDEPAATHLAARLALYRALVATIDGLSSESLNARPQAQRSLSVSGNMFFRSRETQIT